MTKAQQEFQNVCQLAGTTMIDEENAALSCGREFLPEHARKVLDKEDLTAEEETAYYAWLTHGVQVSIDEHEREIAAGHEWHD